MFSRPRVLKSKKMVIINIFILLVLSLISSSGFSADIKVGNDEFNKSAIYITGEIEKGDYEKVVEVTKNYISILLLVEGHANKLKFILDSSDGDIGEALKTGLIELVGPSIEGRNDQLKFILNSSGGDVQEAIKIGLFFRKTLAPVYVWGNRLIHESEKDPRWILTYPSKGSAEKYATQDRIIYSENRPITEDDIKKCYSACVLMFLGGVQKQISDNHYWIDGFRADEKKDIPVIGLHRPYFSQKQYAELSVKEAEVSYKRLEKLVGQYLEEIGATRELIDRMFKSSSNEIDLVVASEFRGMFHREEPFYNEWIIAKCGVYDNGENLLSKEDYAYKLKVSDEKKKEVKRMISMNGGDRMDYRYVDEDYIPDGFSKDKYERIKSVVRSHNMNVKYCKKSAVENHQIELFSESP